MFFTRIGKIIAHLMFWLGLMRVSMGFLVAFGTVDMESNRALAHQYFGTRTSGEAITEGMIAIFLAVALGTLCEIGSRRNSPDEPA